MLQSEQATSTGLVGLKHVAVVSSSKRSAVAAQRASLLPLAPGASVCVFRSVPATGRHGTALSASSTWFDGLLQPAVRAVGGQLRSRTFVQAPHEADQIEAEAAQEGAELVVLAPERESLRHRLFGSTAQRLAGDGQVAVLLARREPVQPYRRALFATDLSSASRIELERTLRILPPEAELSVLHVYDTSYQLVLHNAPSSSREIVRYLEEARAKSERALHAFVAPFSGAHAQLHPLVRGGDPSREVFEVATSLEVDLLILGNHGGSAHPVLGSVASAALRRADCDVLVIPRQATLH